MPELEYLLLADYVRQDCGFTHIMGAGIDTITIDQRTPPGVIPVSAVACVSFGSRDEAGAEHEITLIFQGPGGDELLTVAQRFPAPAPPPGAAGGCRWCGLRQSGRSDQA
jgi:hypothetical protein